jgi:hypothetical protein
MHGYLQQFINFVTVLSNTENTVFKIYISYLPKSLAAKHIGQDWSNVVPVFVVIRGTSGVNKFYYK